MKFWRSLTREGKQLFVGMLTVIGLVVGGIYMLTDGDTQSVNRGVDVVRGIAPISDALAYVAEATDSMATMTMEERGKYLEANHPNLEIGLVYYLRQRNKITSEQEVRRVKFYYGSADDVLAESGDGNQYKGYFENKLVAVVYVSGQEKPWAVIIECLNGTFMLVEDIESRLQLVGDHAPREHFVIGPNEGLVHHVPYRTAIDLAEEHDLVLYRGKKLLRSNIITPDEARALESETGSIQITVYVVEGDEFNLQIHQFTPSALRRGRI